MSAACRVGNDWACPSIIGKPARVQHLCNASPACPARTANLTPKFQAQNQLPRSWRGVKAPPGGTLGMGRDGCVAAPHANRSLLAQLHLGRIRPIHLFDDGLTAAHHTARGVEGIGRAFVQSPTLGQGKADLVAKGGSVVVRQKAIEFQSLPPGLIAQCVMHQHHDKRHDDRASQRHPFEFGFARRGFDPRAFHAIRRLALQHGP